LMKMVEFFLNYQNKDLKTIQEENFEENCHKIQLMSNFQFFLKIQRGKHCEYFKKHCCQLCHHV
jgi:hypothetical protein